MAKVKLSHFVVEIRGKYNGSTFQRTQYGLQLSQKVNQLARRSTSQSRVRQSFSRNARGWRNVSEEDRESWEKPLHPGQNVYNNFQQVNIPRGIQGLPVAAAQPPAPPSFTISTIQEGSSFSIPLQTYQLNLIMSTSIPVDPLDYYVRSGVAYSNSQGATPNMRELDPYNQNILSTLDGNLFIRVVNQAPTPEAPTPQKWKLDHPIQANIRLYHIATGRKVHDWDTSVLLVGTTTP